MATQHNCVCGTPVNRTKGKIYHNASGARGSGRIKPVLKSNTQLCADCMAEFIRNQPNHDNPTEGGTHRLCDWCNDEYNLNIIQKLLTPTITRWKGKVPRWNGQYQTVCTDCRDNLSQFIEKKQA